MSASNGLTFVDAHTVTACIKPATLLLPSAFGAMRARVVRDGAENDSLPIGTLVVLLRLRQLRCSAQPAATCALDGAELYLIASIAATFGFEQRARGAFG